MGRSYSYRASVLIMVTPYVLLGLIWAPLSGFVQNFFDDEKVNQLVVLCLTTTLIFGIALLFDNSSIYDPYWQTVPAYLMIYWSSGKGNLWMPLLAVLYCIKQNFTYFRFWPGLTYEDYRNLAVKKMTPSPIVFWAIIYFGFEMIPAFMIFFGQLPAYYAATEPVNPITYYLGVLMTLSGIILEGVADYQLYPYRMKQKSGNCEVGLWRYSRHPNYFGECLYWCGLYVCGVSAGHHLQFWGALSILGLFLGYSIPDMERHLLEKRASYKDYQRRVSSFIPLMPKRV